MRLAQVEALGPPKHVRAEPRLRPARLGEAQHLLAAIVRRGGGLCALVPVRRFAVEVRQRGACDDSAGRPVGRKGRREPAPEQVGAVVCVVRVLHEGQWGGWVEGGG